MRRVARFGIVLACVGLALNAAGCGKGTPTATPATTPNSPAPSVELGGVKYALVSKPTQVGDIAEGHAGFVDLAAVVVNPEVDGEGKYNWYGHRAATATTAKESVPPTLVSKVILVAREKGGYVFDVVGACGAAESAQTSPMSAWGSLTTDDPAIVKLMPVGSDTCSKPVEQLPQQ